MIIVAGIDEAGLGPTLGPLCVCMTAFAVEASPAGIAGEEPDLWEALAGATGRRPGGKGGAEGRLVVADSKSLHRRGDLRRLERTLAAFLACAGRLPSLPWPRDQVLAALGVDISGLQAIPWYAGKGWHMPAALASDTVMRDYELLAGALRAARVRILHPRARFCPAACLNRGFATGLNKADLLQQQVAAHIVHLLAGAGDVPVLLTVDKLGGRNSYLPFLTRLFPGEWITVAVEGRGVSEYHMAKHCPPLRIRFRAGGDRSCFAVALASMLAKYLRERAMEEVNAFFQERVRGLRPTAGYPRDAVRFLAAVEPKLRQIGVARELLVRER